MRKELDKLKDIRITIIGRFVKYGTKTGYRGTVLKTILLQNITDTNGKFLCDHLWFNFTKGFEAIEPLFKDDTIQLDGRSKQYVKGYVGRNEFGFVEDNRSIDMKLSHPTRIIKLNS